MTKLSLADSGTTHTILQNRLLFTDFVPHKSSVTTMIGSSPVIQGRGNAQLLLPNDTMIHVTDVLYAPKTNRTLLSFIDIRSTDFTWKRSMRMDKSFCLSPLMTATINTS